MKKPEFQMGDFFMVGVNNMKNAAGIRQVEKFFFNLFCKFMETKKKKLIFNYFVHLYICYLSKKSSPYLYI